MGVNAEDTIPEQLGCRYPNILNLAEDDKDHQRRSPLWYASWHEAAQIFFRVMDFSDWIIVFDGLNDTAMSLALIGRAIRN